MGRWPSEKKSCPSWTLWLGMPATLTSKEGLKTSMAKSTSCCRQVLPHASCMFAALSTINQAFLHVVGQMLHQQRGGMPCCYWLSPAYGAQQSPVSGCQTCSNATQHMALQASGCCACQPMSQAAAVSSILPSENCHVCCHTTSVVNPFCYDALFCAGLCVSS